MAAMTRVPVRIWYVCAVLLQRRWHRSSSLWSVLWFLFWFCARGGSALHARPLRDFSASPLQGLTTNQRRLLYLISLYTKPALSATDREVWVRRQALLVLLYEGIVLQAFEYDYAPASVIISGARTFFNVTQEGSSDIDFLREEGLLNNLKRSSSSYMPVLCYQVSARGSSLVARIGRVDRDAVHSIVYAPGTSDLVQALWRDGDWYLVSGGFERKSTVTDCEDVSYVGSAYVPQCLRFGGRPTLSNAHRSAECARASSNIRDKLDEIITLNSVSVIVAEYVPFGANNVAQVNANLGSADRVSGGFFSAGVDDDSGGTRFAVQAGLTSVNVLDYSHTRHVNFEADIYMPEDPGIIQVETLGISINADGTIFHGMQVREGWGGTLADLSVFGRSSHDRLALIACPFFRALSGPVFDTMSPPSRSPARARPRSRPSWTASRTTSPSTSSPASSSTSPSTRPRCSTRS